MSEEHQEQAQGEQRNRKGGFWVAGYHTAIMNGIVAQQILDGDPDAFGPSDPKILNRMVEQGRMAQETCKRMGKEWIIRNALHSLPMDTEDT